MNSDKIEQIIPTLIFGVGVCGILFILYLVVASLIESVRPIEVTVYKNDQTEVFESSRRPSLVNGYAYIYTDDGVIVLRVDRMEWSRK